MKTALLALALAAAPADPTPKLTAYLQATCPPPKQPGESTVEMKEQMGAEVECLKKAMNRELDGFLLPLKQKDQKTFKAWMALQARYNRWQAQSCELVEELSWVDLTTRTRDDGTMRGMNYMGCHSRLHGERAYFGKLHTKGDLAPFWELVKARQDQGQKNLAFAGQALKKGRASKPPTTKPEYGETVADKDFQKLLSGLEASQKAAGELAKEHCALLPAPPADCETQLTHYFGSLPLYDSGN